LLSGLATMAAIALFAFALRDETAGWWASITVLGAATAATLLLLAAVPTTGAARLRPRVEGDAGDVFDDLRLSGYRDNPWRFARRVAFGAGLAVWIAGIVQGDPIDGAIQGFAESLACLAGFAAFGRFLGLRR
jgi:hypothetical protein